MFNLLIFADQSLSYSGRPSYESFSLISVIKVSFYIYIQLLNVQSKRQPGLIWLRGGKALTQNSYFGPKDFLNMMNFSAAVKGSFSSFSKLCTIQSSWETEFGQQMTDEDKASLSKCFTIDETYTNIQKVL